MVDKVSFNSPRENADFSNQPDLNQKDSFIQAALEKIDALAKKPDELVNTVGNLSKIRVKSSRSDEFTTLISALRQRGIHFKLPAFNSYKEELGRLWKKAMDEQKADVVVMLSNLGYIHANENPDYKYSSLHLMEKLNLFFEQLLKSPEFAQELVAEGLLSEDEVKALSMAVVDKLDNVRVISPAEKALLHALPWSEQLILDLAKEGCYVEYLFLNMDLPFMEKMEKFAPSLFKREGKASFERRHAIEQALGGLNAEQEEIAKLAIRLGGGKS